MFRRVPCDLEAQKAFKITWNPTKHGLSILDPNNNALALINNSSRAELTNNSKPSINGGELKCVTSFCYLVPQDRVRMN